VISNINKESLTTFSFMVDFCILKFLDFDVFDKFE